MNRVLPILFNTDMVRAILDGRKMVTRRVIKKSQCNCLVKIEPSEWDKECLQEPWRSMTDEGFIRNSYKEPYQKGDILYVRETWGHGYDEGTYIYKADDKLAELPTFKESTKMIYEPSIHMPKEAARIWLKVTDVRVERLQDITPLGILAEGIRVPAENEFDSEMSEEAMREFAFMTVWNSTIKKSNLDHYGWEANPWVWVIEFERCDRPQGWPG